MKIALTILIFIITTSIYGQYNRFKWPYIKAPSPSYMSIYTGLSDRNLKSFEIGIGLSVAPMCEGKMNLNAYDSIHPKDRGYLSGFVGPLVTYRFNQIDKIQTFTFGLSVKTPFSLGIDFVINHKLNDYLYSIRPLIGLYLFHFNLEYGYNFFLNETGFKLKNGDFRIGINIPIMKLQTQLSIKNKIIGNAFY